MADPTSEEPFFHEASGAVRFWVLVGDKLLAASISREALHYGYRPKGQGEDPLETFHQNTPDIEAAVRRRFTSGALEPVMLREYDLHVQGAQGAS